VLLVYSCRAAKGDCRTAKGEVDASPLPALEANGDATGMNIVRLRCDGVSSSLSPSLASSISPGSSYTAETRPHMGELEPLRPRKGKPLEWPPSSSDVEDEEETGEIWFWRISCWRARVAGWREGGTLERTVSNTIRNEESIGRKRGIMTGKGEERRTEGEERSTQWVSWDEEAVGEGVGG
jgi:hypothetical protein